MCSSRKIVRKFFALFLVLGLLASYATAAERSIITDPEKAMQMLVEGNKRFMEGHIEKHDISKAKKEDLFKNGQNPFATVVSCSDSRVPPELVFDQGLGDIFVVRVAGNILDSVGMGSVEYSAAVVKTPLIVVVGHEKCGAVHATLQGEEVSPNITSIANMIQPAVDSVRGLKGWKISSEDIQEDVSSANVKQVVEQLKANEILKKLISEKKLKVVGAKYHLDDGKVEFFE